MGDIVWVTIGECVSNLVRLGARSTVCVEVLSHSSNTNEIGKIIEIEGMDTKKIYLNTKEENKIVDKREKYNYSKLCP